MRILDRARELERLTVVHLAMDDPASAEGTLRELYQLRRTPMGNSLQGFISSLKITGREVAKIPPSYRGVHDST